MNKEEIIAIYIEVSNKLCNGTEWCWAGVDEPLQLFAKLVAEKAIKEALAQEQEPVTDEEIKLEAKYFCHSYHSKNPERLVLFARAILRKAQEK